MQGGRGREGALNCDTRAISCADTRRPLHGTRQHPPQPLCMTNPHPRSHSSRRQTHAPHFPSRYHFPSRGGEALPLTCGAPHFPSRYRLQPHHHHRKPPLCPPPLACGACRASSRACRPHFFRVIERASPAQRISPSLTRRGARRSKRGDGPRPVHAARPATPRPEPRRAPHPAARRPRRRCRRRRSERRHRPRNVPSARCRRGAAGSGGGLPHRRSQAGSRGRRAAAGAVAGE